MKRSVLLYLSFIPFVLSAQMHFDWAFKVVNNNPNFSGRCMTVDSLGNIYYTAKFGIVGGATDLNPTSGTYIVPTSGHDNIYIVKLDSSGNFIWAKTFLQASVGGGSSYPTAIAVDKWGNVYTTGLLPEPLDMDPGTGTSVSSGTSYISKLDSSGNLVWVKYYDQYLNMQINSMAIDHNCNVLITGSFSTSIDFDPGPGTYNLNAGINSRDVFISKLDSAGNFAWAKKIGESVYDQIGYSVCCDYAGNVYVSGVFPGTVDFNPGAGVYNISSFGSDMFVLNLDSNGDFVWAVAIGTSVCGSQPRSMKLSDSNNLFIVGRMCDNNSNRIIIVKINTSGVYKWSKNIAQSTYNQAGYSLALDEIDNVYIAGYFQDTVDFNPGLGVANLVSSGEEDIYVAKYDSLGNFIQAKGMGGTLADKAHAVELDSRGNILLFGHFEGTADLDPSSGVFNLTTPYENGFLCRLTQGPCSDVGVSIDTLSNVSCSSMSGFSSGHGFNGQAPYSYAWNSVPPIMDSSSFFNGSGIYTLTITDANLCSNSSSVLVNGPENINTNDKGINLVAGPFRKNSVAYIYADAFNDGCSFLNGQISVVLDTLLLYDYAIPTPDLISGDTLFWNYSDLSYSSAHFVPKIVVTVPLYADIGDTVRLKANILPLTGDSDSTNNSKTYFFPVINSYDPNDKQVYPRGECSEGYVLKEQKLTYTIRFQNTGNASAINIAIIDSLSPFLDINTLRIMGSSHPVFAEILQNNVVKFRFDDIYLPDNTTNDSLSNGYVVFEIEPFSFVSNNAIVKNRAYIYFDFNPPIITNTVRNRLVNVIPECTISGISNNAKEKEVLIYPNPANDIIAIKCSFKVNKIEILNCWGAVEYYRENNMEEYIHTAHLKTGVYFVKITDNRNITIVRKFIKL
jgi:hypothetical protein